MYFTEKGAGILSLVLLKMEQLELMILSQMKNIKHEEEIQLIFDTLKQLLNSSQQSSEPFGYKRNAR